MRNREERMSDRGARSCWFHTAALAALIFVVLPITEAYASHGNPLVAPRAPWTAHIRDVQEALTRRDVLAAESAWRDAYSAALGGPSWEGMIVVGDAARRVAVAAGFVQKGEAKARWSYLLALVRAREEGSLDGVIRVAEAFRSLGDGDIVDLCMRIAESLVAQGRDVQSRNRARALKQLEGGRR